MKDFFTYDAHTIGSKGLIIIGRCLLTYRRDTHTPSYPLCIDLPGGGVLVGETPFMTFQREVYEEFGLSIQPQQIVYARRYASDMRPGYGSYFPVAYMPAAWQQYVRLGNEGISVEWLTVSQYLRRTDVAWPSLQTRALDYLRSLQGR